MMHERKPGFATTTLAELTEWTQRRGFPKFRAGQIGGWLWQKFVTNPAQMTNIPQAVRDALAEDFEMESGVSELRSESSDGTEKHLIRLPDGESVECVAIPAPDRITFCLSSQAGCPVKCHFCASGADGLKRNLTAAEIIVQFLILTQACGRPPTNIVFMGMGEPLLNFDAVALAIDRLTDPGAFNISPRRITVSTSGIVSGIERLAALDKPLYLALSLHATDDATRAKLIPDAFREPIGDILRACEDFVAMHNRLITLEYTLIHHVNDSLKAAEELAQIAFKLRAKVNLIPYNRVEGSPFKRPDDFRIRAFTSALERGGAMVTVRRSKGNEANAACGQLRRAKDDLKA